MRRSFIYIPARSNLKLKILLSNNDGYWIGGDRSTPQFITSYSDSTYETIFLEGITATGPGANDWIASGSGGKRIGTAGGGFPIYEVYVLFYDSTGLIKSAIVAEQNSYLISSGGLFSSVRGLNAPSVTYQWETPTAGSTAPGLASAFEFGYVLPNVLSQLQNSPSTGALRKVVSLDPTLAYAVTIGNQPASGPSTNPNLFISSGSYVKLSANLNDLIRNSSLIWPVLYTLDQDFVAGPNYESTQLADVEVTPYTLTTGGNVTTGTPFTIQYQQNEGFQPEDASYYP